MKSVTVVDIRPPRMVKFTCICVFQRAMMFGAYKAGHLGSTVGRMDRLTRLKIMIAASIADHENGRCRDSYSYIYGDWLKP